MFFYDIFCTTLKKKMFSFLVMYWYEKYANMKTYERIDLLQVVIQKSLFVFCHLTYLIGQKQPHPRNQVRWILCEKCKRFFPQIRWKAIFIFFLIMSIREVYIINPIKMENSISFSGDDCENVHKIAISSYYLSIFSALHFILYFLFCMTNNR